VTLPQKGSILSGPYLDKTLVHPVSGSNLRGAADAWKRPAAHRWLPNHSVAVPSCGVECRLVTLSIFADMTEVGEFGRFLVVFRDNLVKRAPGHPYPRMSRLPLVKQLELRIIQISRSDNTAARREKGAGFYLSCP
jgi:hypothetical protein